MPKVVQKTKVQGNFLDVENAFDRPLFEFLLPIFPKVELKRFDGCSVGDKVELFFPGFGFQWHTQITVRSGNEEECWFIDEGSILPTPLKKWKHTHRFIKISETETIIQDEYNFSCSNKVFEILMIPIIYLGFLPRKRLYKKFFRQVPLKVS